MTPHKCFSTKAAKKYQDLGYWESLSLGEHLEAWGRQFQNKTAIVEGDIRLSYGELVHKVRKLASGLLNMGIRKEDRVVIQLPNSISFVTACFALFRIGAVPVLAMPAHRASELNGIFELAKPSAYIIPDTYLGFDYGKMAKTLLKNHPCVKFLIKDSAGQDLFTQNELILKALNIDPPSHTDTAVLLLSGGTTGTPKLIPRTHADYAYNARASAQKCRMDQSSVYLAVLPIAHNFPLACPGIIGTLFSGGTVVLSKTTGCDEAFPLIQKEGVTITALVPAMVNLWLQVLEWEETDLSSLRLVQVGGSPLDENLARQIAPKMGCTLQQVFGMAEGLLCYTDPGDPIERIISCQGKPLSPHDEIRIVDGNGNEVPQGETGELLVRGPYTIQGYYRAPEQNLKEFTPDGFYKSGDTVMMTESGDLCVMGRIKEQINRAGEKIVAAEVESYINAFPGIMDSALVAIPDESLGEKSCAFVIPEDGSISMSQIHDHLESLGVARYKMPDQIECIDAWPLTSVGKIDKKKLKSLVTKKKHYHETRLDFDKDPLVAACQLIESLAYGDYLLYENKEEWSLGLGIEALIAVDFRKTVLSVNGNTQIFENRNLGDTLDEVFRSLPYSGWRAYGTADFELSYYNYGIEFPDHERKLLKLFIPKAEIRFTRGEILLRALDREELNQISSAVKTALGTLNGDIVLFQRAGKCEDIPEISTYDNNAYKEIVKCAVEEIRAPKYEKIILSRRIPLSRRIDMLASYVAGRKANTPARSFILKIEDFMAAGFSPETVVEVDENRNVSTQPLAGTRSTGTGGEEETRLRKELLTDAKEISEHAISIKLAFEEMQQVCDEDSILLQNFMGVARRGTVQHLASRLKGRLKRNKNPWHAFKVLFPAVTATGIPKRESIQAIKKHETQIRGLYSGCVMTHDHDGKMDAALVLRTFYQKGNKTWLRAGAGIVNLSEPERELEETCEKLRSVSRQIVYAN